MCKLCHVFLLWHRDASKMADATTMLSICDPVHMVLIKTDTSGDTTLILLIFLTGGKFSVLPTGRPMSQQNCWEWVSKCHIIKGEHIFFHNTQFTQNTNYMNVSSVEHKRRYFD